MNTLPPNFELYKYGLNVRFVTEEDAEFILQLRTDERLGRYINHTENNIETQRHWIQKYKYLESNGKEYYFIFETQMKNPLGVYRLYEISDESFTSGSWIFLPNAPLGASMLAFIIAREIAWEITPGAKNYFDIKKNNSSVLQFTSKFHPKVIKETEDTLYFENTREDFEKNKNEILKIFSNRMEKLCALYDSKLQK